MGAMAGALVVAAAGASSAAFAENPCPNIKRTDKRRPPISGVRWAEIAKEEVFIIEFSMG